MKKVKSKKKKKNLENSQKILIGGLTVVVLLVLLCLGFYGMINSHQVKFKIEDRVGKMEEKQEIYDEKVVGWLRVQGTNIDYPIIYDNGYADVNNLNYDFLWTNEDEQKLGNREIVFGHNLLNLSKKPLITDPNHSRFEQLMSFIYYDFAKENLYVQYSIGEENYLYKIFAISFIDDSELSYYDKNFSKEDLKQYIDDAREESFFNYDVDVDSDDDILSLVTCTRFYGYNGNVDFKVDARRVRKNEAIDHYKVAESEKYDKIKEEMKGEEANEKV